MDKCHVACSKQYKGKDNIKVCTRLNIVSFLANFSLYFFCITVNYVILSWFFSVNSVKIKL